MTKPSPLAWRIAAALLWIVSIVCLFEAIGAATVAEQSLSNPNITAADHLTIKHESEVADRWDSVGWILQFFTASVLAFGLASKRVVRRIFVSLGVLIAADGVTLLLMAVIIR